MSTRSRNAKAKMILYNQGIDIGQTSENQGQNSAR